MVSSIGSGRRLASVLSEEILVGALLAETLNASRKSFGLATRLLNTGCVG